MTNDQKPPQRASPEVTTALLAVLTARSALHPKGKIPTRTRLANPPRISTAPSEPPKNDQGSCSLASEDSLVPTAEALEAVQEAALAQFPEHVQAAVRARLAQFDQGSVLGERQPITRTDTPTWRPTPIPPNMPRRPETNAPPFPQVGFDDANVRAEWESAYRKAAEARYMLLPAVLRAYAEAQLACEKWDAVQRGRKPSGDLRNPVPRDRLKALTAEMTVKHERAIALAERTIHAIQTGDVIGVKVDDVFGADDWNDSEGDGPLLPNRFDLRVVTLLLQSDLEQEAARKLARDGRTPEEVELERIEWERLVDEMAANLPPDGPTLEVPNLPDWPTDREPTSAEVGAVSNAILKHVDYLKKGDQIEDKRQKDAATKVRTKARRDAQQADPGGTAAAKQATMLEKAAARQRRWREQQHEKGRKA